MLDSGNELSLKAETWRGPVSAALPSARRSCSARHAKRNSCARHAKLGTGARTTLAI